MKRNALTRIISVLLSIILVTTIAPIYAIAEETKQDTISTLESQLKTKMLTYTGNTQYTSNVKMGNKTVLPYYYKNLIYSSSTLTTSYTYPASTIEVQIRCPKVIIGVYDGSNLPVFPVTAFYHLTNECKMAGLVLADEEGLYETASPTNDKGCTNMWRGVNDNVSWHTPEDAESIFTLASKRADWQYKVFYTRGNYNGYDVTLSNTLTPRVDYLTQALNESGNGYIYSDYNDTAFNFAYASYSDGTIYSYNDGCPLGSEATQYILDTSMLLDAINNARTTLPKIYKYNNKYDADALIRYYQATLDILNYSVSNAFSGVNDSNAGNLVSQVATNIQALVDEYNDSYEALGQLYIDPSVVKAYVESNYQNAEVTRPSKSIVFGGVTVNDVSKWNESYNFGMNLAYCSPKVIQGPNTFVNNVSSCTVVPATVVMIYDGINETSFPIKWAYGVSQSNSGYSGANLHTIFLGDEYSDNWGSGSRMYTLGNYYWLDANHTSPAVDIDKWFTSADQINSRCENVNMNNGTSGINLSLQYGGFYNKVVLSNGLYSNSLEIEPLNKPINLNVRYYWMGNDQTPHRASNNTKQYVLNIIPLVEKIEKMKKDYAQTVGTYGYDKYTKSSVEKYYRAIYNLISFSIEDEYSNCTDTNAKAKTEQCVEKINTLSLEYEDAYKELKRQYTITFKNYAGETVDTQTCAENDIPSAPENTNTAKGSSTSKYHFVYSWPTINKATSDLIYYERRNSVLCTLDDGTVTKEPTCQNTGTKEYHCSVCNGIMYETIDKLEHSYDTFKPQYKDGTRYSNSLKHNFICSIGGEAVYEETCTFRLIADGDATTIYGCDYCGGMTIYYKAQYNIKFTVNNSDIISSKDYYEDQVVEIPNLPESFNDENGHHSFSWDNEPSATPTKDVTYNATELIAPHSMGDYIYNSNATVSDIYGTETSKCSVCDYEITRACQEPHAPTKFNIVGKIVLANSTTGNASNIAISNATVTIVNSEKAATTNSNGEFTLTDLEAGEYEIVISSDSSIDRTATLTVNLDEAGLDGVKEIGAIGLVNLDYNKDGKINTVDATLHTRKGNNLNTATIFKSLFNKPIKYSDIRL